MKRIFPLLLFFTVFSVTQAGVLDDIQIKEFHSEQIADVAQFQGKIIYLDFWASWCKPCKRSFPFMNELTDTYPADEFQVIAINMDENKSDAEAFLEKIPANFTILTNPGNELAKKLGVPGLPVAYIIDKQGNMVARHIGFNDRKKAKKQKQIAYLLEQP